ncbi:class I SAM-dependent methyltransferase [Aminipila butyrica]|uniref:Class I SAM-dependent methyltransferase n=1 Tax=Aminipila butyrica TaxID=433296 RepID=A0A858C143_9FIRM|nr:class I SAM-dependent methyltransferase [Aminipila butyrica]QIB70156.1 class I SAM-dependent methyltransferase [Aminipila butyrica]
MYNNIFRCLQRPTLYKQSEVNFWDDEHISKYMLKAHLNPDYEGASRKWSFIEQSVKWIQEMTPPAQYRHLLDLGCGPGLYAERFSKAGYKVTGIDFSKRSIAYAKASAEEHGLDITYLSQDYLKMDFNETFDLATFIYCDYGALSTENRRDILQRIYHSLKRGGKLLFDVFSIITYNEFQETTNWAVHDEGGFWSAEKYLSLNAQYKYPGHVTLEQTLVLTDQTIREYCIWNCCFTLEMLIKEAQEAGFNKVDVFGDVTGKPYAKDSPTIAVLLHK